MELKSFLFTHPESKDDWIEEYTVLYREGGKYNTEIYILNAESPAEALAIYPAEIDHYLTILTWMKEHQEAKAEEKAIRNGDAEPISNRDKLLDSEHVLEEDG